ERHLEAREASLVRGSRLREGEFQRALRRVEHVVGDGRGIGSERAAGKDQRRRQQHGGRRSPHHHALGPWVVVKGSIRRNTLSRSMKWCLSAAATCSVTTAANTHASVSCVVSSAAYSDLFFGTRSGSVKNPNQLTGNPRADDIIQPESGMANSSAY